MLCYICTTKRDPVPIPGCPRVVGDDEDDFNDDFEDEFQIKHHKDTTDRQHSVIFIIFHISL